MNIEECYKKIGGDYNEVLNRFRDPMRVKRFALMFLKDDSYKILAEAMSMKDYDVAFRGAHTLKGVCMNLGFTSFYNSVYQLTEALRAKKIEESISLFEMVSKQYNAIITVIQELDNSLS